jgi:cobalamin biosynthesis Co2+ chelatase CbiK
MKVLLFAAHGSRKENSNLEIADFYEKVSKNLQGKIDKGLCCFLQFGKPGIEEAIETLIKEGAFEIYIFPYFLFNGSHVKEDLPLIKKNFESKYKGIKIKIFDVLSMAEGFDFFISDYIGKRLVTD